MDECQMVTFDAGGKKPILFSGGSNGNEGSGVERLFWGVKRRTNGCEGLGWREMMNGLEEVNFVISLLRIFKRLYL